MMGGMAQHCRNWLDLNQDIAQCTVDTTPNKYENVASFIWQNTHEEFHSCWKIIPMYLGNIKKRKIYKLTFMVFSILLLK